MEDQSRVVRAGEQGQVVVRPGPGRVLEDKQLTLIFFNANVVRLYP